MVQYTHEEQKTIENVFRSFDNREIQFIVPRGYQDLPKSVSGSDIDIFVKPDQYEKAIDTIEDQEFTESGSVVSRLLMLGHGALQNPSRAKKILFSEPERLHSLVRKAIFGTTSSNELAMQFTEYKAEKGSIILHIMNHVAYKSPYNQQKVRVDPQVENYLYDRARSINGLSVPSQVDELAHLICRGIFDYEGEFPDYYIRRCNHLRSSVFEEEKSNEQFKELLSLIFFNADTIVYECVIDENYESMREELIKFSEY